MRLGVFSLVLTQARLSINRFQHFRNQRLRPLFHQGLRRRLFAVNIEAL